MHDHVADVLGQQPESLLGRGDALHTFHPLGDVTPRHGDEVAAHVVPADVVMLWAGQDLVVIEDLVDDDRLVCFDTMGVPAQQSGEPEIRHRLQRRVSDQRVSRQPQVLTGCAVDIAVDEVGDLPAGIPHPLK